MALHRGRATSRCTGQIHVNQKETATSAVWLCLYLLFPPSAEAGLYSATDQVIVLTPENVNSVLVNSTAAIVAEFYASWCGHCVAFSPIYKSLARDLKGWYGPAESHVAANAKMEVNIESAFHDYSKPLMKVQNIHVWPQLVYLPEPIFILVFGSVFTVSFTVSLMLTGLHLPVLLYTYNDEEHQAVVYICLLAHVI